MLEYVPGVVITQHSGVGKANQYFLRGFNLDHGTDFATSVAGMSVNLPSHAHGQGYSDLNFLIPELISRVDYRKGPYSAALGDFASAGAADIRYADSLKASLAKLSPWARTRIGGCSSPDRPSRARDSSRMRSSSGTTTGRFSIPTIIAS